MSRGARHRLAHLEVAAGAFMISFSPIWVQLAGVAPSVSGFYRVSLGALILWLLVALGKRKYRASGSSLVLSCVLGFVFAVDLTVWHRSIAYVGPGMATILGNFQVFVMAGFGMLFLGERLTARFSIAVPAALGGLVLMFGIDWSWLGERYRIGVGLGLLTAVLYASVLLGLRALQLRDAALHPVATMAWLSTAAALILAAGIAGSGGTFAVPSRSAGIALSAYAAVSHVAGWVLITDGIPRIAASRAGLLLLLQPSLAFIWEMVFFGRATTALELVGAGITLGAIYLAAIRDGEQRREGGSELHAGLGAQGGTSGCD